ncbi:MAG: S8 family peptidase [Bacteroidia bacterium]
MRTSLLLLFCLMYLGLSAQKSNYYFIGFKDKPRYKETLNQPFLYISQKAIDRRLKYKVPVSSNDIPPDSGYMSQMLKLPLEYCGQTRWFNGFLAKIPQSFNVDSIRKFPFVEKVEYLGPYVAWEEEVERSETPIEENIGQLEESFKKKDKRDTSFFGVSSTQFKQLNYGKFFQEGNFYPGEGMRIAVIDAGFKNMDNLQAFKHLFKEKRIVSSYDFVEREEEVFDDDVHGLAVISCLASRIPSLLMGTAPNADYILLRSENAVSEYLLEEYYWLQAAEYADSAGADIINSSLGYTKHDVSSMGHKYKELNGQTTVVSRAAEIAASKGMLIFVSAGNEGMDVWRQISAPADAEHVISVGAVAADGDLASFSSVGPTADKRIKPDVVAFGKGISVLSENGSIYPGNGTSYAAPVLAGTAAYLMKKYPRRSLNEIRDTYKLAANQYYKPAKQKGWGIPDIDLMCKFLGSTKDSLLDAQILDNGKMHISLRLKQSKSVKIRWLNGSEVVEEESFSSKNPGTFRFESSINKKRLKGVTHLSVLFQDYENLIQISGY